MTNCFLAAQGIFKPESSFLLINPLEPLGRPICSFPPFKGKPTTKRCLSASDGRTSGRSDRAAQSLKAR